MKTRRANLQNCELNFAAVPDEEWRTCCYWEYARESAFIRQVRESCREAVKNGYCNITWQTENRPWRTLWQALGRTAVLFQEGIYALGGSGPALSLFPQPSPFPQPWQKLAPDTRRLLVETAQWTPYMLVDFPAFRVSHPGRALALAEQVRREPKTKPDPLKTKPYPSFSYTNGLEVLLVEIDWPRFTNEEIIAAFREWVTGNRPKGVAPPPKRGHKPVDWLAKLERLGLLRLRHDHTVEETIQILCKTLPLKERKRRKFIEPGHVNLEAKKAVTDFRALFPFLDEKPRSWPMK